MALKPLHPGYLPLGQYDLKDTVTTIVGGEVGIFETTPSGDYYAADAGGSTITPDVKIKLGQPGNGEMYGLVDEGTAGYGTLFGTVIGGTVGQGTGFSSGAYSTSATNTVVVGPKTFFGSGKATLWTMPGLYGVTGDAFTGSAPTTVNQKIHAASSGLLEVAGSGPQVAIFLNSVSDSSLVSTTAAAATGTSLSAPEYYAVYLLGPSKA
jgi:hypothetical protein